MTTINFRTDSYPAKIYALGQVIFESKSNSEIAAIVNCSNEGQIANARRSVADKTGWTMPGRESTATATPTPRSHKKSGSLPAKIEGCLVGLVDEVPEVWTPDHVLPIIEADEVSWNRFIRRMNDLDSSMILSFERWLGHGATMSRQEEFIEREATEAEYRKQEKIRELIFTAYELDPSIVEKTVREIIVDLIP